MKFNFLLIAFFLCIKNAMSMIVTDTTNEEKLARIRQTLLSHLATTSIINSSEIEEESQESTDTGDIFLSHGKIQLIGTNSGHLIIVNDSHKTFEKVKVHHGAVSCITANGNIVATGSTESNIINRWHINTCDTTGKSEINFSDKIFCKSPIIHMQVIKNLFFTIDVHGCISLFDWRTGSPFCHMETKISKPILNAIVDSKTGFIIIMTSKTKFIVNVNSLIRLDAIICSLNEELLAQLYQIITSDIHKDYTKSEYYANLPYQIRNLLTELPGI